MMDEPEIVKEMRELERSGKLQFLLVDFNETENNTLFPSPRDKIVDMMKQPDDKPVKITSYENALELARKVLNDLDKK